MHDVIFSVADGRPGFPRLFFLAWIVYDLSVLIRGCASDPRLRVWLDFGHEPFARLKSDYTNKQTRSKSRRTGEENGRVVVLDWAVLAAISC